MKKLLILIGLLAIANGPMIAKADDWREEYREHRHHRPYSREVIAYYPRPRFRSKPYREVVRYYPQQPRYRYYPQPYPQPYAAPYYQNYSAYPSYQGGYQNYPGYQNQGIIPGLAGGVIGGAVGYGLGSGNPLTTGLGAVAGSYLANRVWR